MGIVVVTLATLPFAFIDANTPYALLGGILVVRGFGFGFAFMPAMATAYAMLEPQAVPRATSALNAINRVGGSIGVALLAVVLQHQLATQVGATSGGGASSLSAAPASQNLGDQLANAFSHTFVWGIALSAVALIPATVLAVTCGGRLRRRRRVQADAPVGAT
jgi:hypothetical protein